MIQDSFYLFGELYKGFWVKKDSCENILVLKVSGILEV